MVETAIDASLVGEKLDRALDQLRKLASLRPDDPTFLRLQERYLELRDRLDQGETKRPVELAGEVTAVEDLLESALAG
ncbi:MAG: hypothetical protein HY791_30835 [Deltaproteobacteria bacterium]|nr:hypothetical protein [Deltaproteobacteria bacterium]